MDARPEHHRPQDRPESVGLTAMALIEKVQKLDARIAPHRKQGKNVAVSTAKAIAEMVREKKK
jgi:hypothetical protein